MSLSCRRVSSTILILFGTSWIISLLHLVYASVAAKYPWGSQQLRYRSHSVIKVVSFLLESSRGMAWNPSTGSRTVFFVCSGTWHASWKVGWQCHIEMISDRICDNHILISKAQRPNTFFHIAKNNNERKSQIMFIANKHILQVHVGIGVYIPQRRVSGQASLISMISSCLSCCHSS